MVEGVRRNTEEKELDESGTNWDLDDEKEVASPWVTLLRVSSIVHLVNSLKELQKSLHDEMTSRAEKRSRIIVSSQFHDLVRKLLYEIPEDVIRTPRIAGRLMSILRHVKQRGTVDDYVSCFIEVARVVIEFVARVDYKLEDVFLVMSFVNGLKEEIRYDVQDLEPKSLSEAVECAIVQEKTLILQREKAAITQEIKELLKCIKNHRLVAKSLPTTEREYVMFLCSKAEHWLRRKILHQKIFPNNVKGSYEIRLTTQVLNSMCSRVLEGILKNKTSISEEDMADYMCEAQEGVLEATGVHQVLEEMCILTETIEEPGFDLLEPNYDSVFYVAGQGKVTEVQTGTFFEHHEFHKYQPCPEEALCTFPSKIACRRRWKWNKNKSKFEKKRPKPLLFVANSYTDSAFKSRNKKFKKLKPQFTSYEFFSNLKLHFVQLEQAKEDKNMIHESWMITIAVAESIRSYEPSNFGNKVLFFDPGGGEVEINQTIQTSKHVPFLEEPVGMVVEEKENVKFKLDVKEKEVVKVFDPGGGAIDESHKLVNSGKRGGTWYLQVL